MMKQLLGMTVLTLGAVNAWAEDEKKEKSYPKQEFRAKIGGSINQVADGTIYLFDNSASYRYEHKKYIFNTRANWMYGETWDKVTNRDISWGGDGNLFWNDERRWYSWLLFNAQTAYSLKINHQYQAGVGIAYNFFHDTLHYYINISDGIIYEQSSVTTTDEAILDYETIRNSLRLNMGYKWEKIDVNTNEKKEILSIRTNNFWQPSLRDKHDYNITSKTDIAILLYKDIHFTTSLTYNKISRTEKENLLFNYGISFHKKF